MRLEFVQGPTTWSKGQSKIPSPPTTFIQLPATPEVSRMRAKSGCCSLLQMWWRGEGEVNSFRADTRSITQKSFTFTFKLEYKKPRNQRKNFCLNVKLKVKLRQNFIIKFYLYNDIQIIYIIIKMITISFDLRKHL